MDRQSATVTLTNSEGETDRLTAALDPGESVLSQVSDPSGYPELAFLRRELATWRFYHHFDSIQGSPIRRIQPGVRTHALAADGSDLGAAVATMIEAGNYMALFEAVDAAFPKHKPIVIGEDAGHFGIALETGFRRPMKGTELSDGQIRFLCLAVALLSDRPPPLLVLNEPETSLHPRAVAALAELVRHASQWSQIWITTHDSTLRDELADIATLYRLSNPRGATTLESDD